MEEEGRKRLAYQGRILVESSSNSVTSDPQVIRNDIEPKNVS
jgi:hypothetical protein